MQIRLRHIDQAESKPFDEGSIEYVHAIIAFIERSGGVQYDGDYRPFHSYQLVLDESGAYAEVLVGEDPE